MQDITLKEIKSPDGQSKVGILIYTGSENPARQLDRAVNEYVANNNYTEFIDSHLDNPWMRVVVIGINNINTIPNEA